MLKPVYRKFAEEFAGKINAGDFRAAHPLFAPWLQGEITVGLSPHTSQMHIE